MRREVAWSGWFEPGNERLLVTTDEGGVLADGLVVGVAEGKPFQISYEVRCDQLWRARAVRVSNKGDASPGPGVDLLADGEGNWTTRDGEAVPGLEGCIDADISATPFTNTLPIRRLGLAPGESAELLVAYVDVREMGVWTEGQRYTCLRREAGGALYRFESLDGDFTADLPVDADGLVLDYPGLFKRGTDGPKLSE